MRAKPNSIVKVNSTKRHAKKAITAQPVRQNKFLVRPDTTVQTIQMCPKSARKIITAPAVLLSSWNAQRDISAPTKNCTCLSPVNLVNTKMN